MKLFTFQNYWSLMKGSNPATINTELTLEKFETVEFTMDNFYKIVQEIAPIAYSSEEHGTEPTKDPEGSLDYTI